MSEYNLMREATAKFTELFLLYFMLRHHTAFDVRAIVVVVLLSPCASNGRNRRGGVAVKNHGNESIFISTNGTKVYTFSVFVVFWLFVDVVVTQEFRCKLNITVLGTIYYGQPQEHTIL